MKRERKLQLFKKFGELGQQFHDVIDKVLKKSAAEIQAAQRPAWFDGLYNHLLRKVAFPQSNLNNLTNNQYVYEPANIGGIHGSIRYTADSIQRMKRGKGQVPPKYAKLHAQLTLPLSRIMLEMSRILTECVDNFNWAMQQRKIYHRHFTEAYCAGRGEVQYLMLYAFFIYHWRLVMQCKNLTQLHQLCVKAKFYAGDLDSFRRQCSRLGIKLAPRGRTKTNATTSPSSPS